MFAPLLLLGVDLAGTWTGRRVAVLPLNATEAQRATALMKAEMGGKGDVTLVLAKDGTATITSCAPVTQDRSAVSGSDGGTGTPGSSRRCSP